MLKTLPRYAWHYNVRTVHVPTRDTLYFYIMNRRELYSELYSEMDSALKMYKICGVRINKKGQVTCRGMKERIDRKPGSLCCHNCEHLSEKGCRIQSLGCKIWLCEQVRSFLYENRKKVDIQNFMTIQNNIKSRIEANNIPSFTWIGKSKSFKIQKEHANETTI